MTDNNFLVLDRMCLNNWHYINEKILSFNQEINFFTGHSGSGKSTIIDALQLVLYADSNGKSFFNKAAKEDSDRSLMEYLRGMKTVRDNDEIGYLRNQNFSSNIVLEFRHAQTGVIFCVGVVFDVDVTNNEINRLFFAHSGRFPENHYRTGKRCATIAEIKNILKMFPEEETFSSSTNSRFRRELYDRWFGGLNPDKFIALFKKAIPFRMDMKLEDFVGSYICMEKDIRIEEMQDSVTQYVRLKRKLEETREEIGLLEKIREAYGQYDCACQDKELYQYAQNAVDITALTTEINQSINKANQLSKALELLEETLKNLEEENSIKQEERDDMVRRLENSGYNNVENSLRHVNETLERCYVSRSAFDRMAQGLQTWKRMPGIPHTLIPVIEQVQSYGADLPGLKRIKEAIDRVREDLNEQKDENTTELRGVQKDIKNLRSQIQELESGRKSYPAYLMEAKSRLEEELSVRVGRSVPVEVLADLIEIKDENWQNAVEGFMGNNKLTLIVAPEYAKAAMEAYQQLDAGQYHQAAVIDTEKVMADQKPRRRGSLAEEIECELPYVQAYVDFLMGNLMKCQDIDELRKNRSGITSKCVLYQGYKLQHINPRNYNEWAYIGKKSMQRKLDALKKRLNYQLSELAPLKELNEYLEERLAMESLSQDFTVLMGQQADVLAIAGKEAEKAKLEKQLAELKRQNVDEWKARKALLDAEMKVIARKSQMAGSEKLDKERELKREKDSVVEKEKLLQDKNQELGAKNGDEKAEARREALDSAYQRLLEELDGSSFDRIRRVIAQRLGEARDHQEQCYSDLLAARNRHQSRFSFREMDTLNRKNDGYDQLLDDLSEKRLPEFVERSGELARIAVEQFKNDFIYKIRSAIKEAMQQKDDMNRILSRMDFGKDRYRFIVTKNRGADGRFYDLFMDEALEINPNQLIGHMENQMNMFTMEHESRYGDMIQELIEYFIPPENATERELEEARRNLERYADYRTYLSFDMEQLVEGMAPAKLSRMLSKNSGGEGQNPLYVALLASFAQVYRMNLKVGVRRRATPRLVVLDEAFSQMDGEKVGSCIKLIRDLGYQAIISATNDKIQNYLESVNKAFVFANPDKSRIYIQEFERSQFHELMTEKTE